MIDQETIDRIYAAANIVEVVGDYVTLKRFGVNYKACCPFHNEKTPSFVVSPSKGLYKCFGCGKGGNAVTFVMEHENITYPEALKMVAKKYGIEVKEKEQTEEDIQRNNNRESMFMLNSWASDYFSNYLHENEEGISVGLSYFRQARAFSEATIRKFGLGFCPSGRNVMSQAAIQAGYKEEFLLSTGLSLKSEGSNELRDRFRDRVIFPIHNIAGRVVGFGGRTLHSSEEQKRRGIGKYQNSPESEIYSKSREIYGLYFAKKSIQLQNNAIVVEGYADVISMHQSGIENVVASSGTAFTEEQVRLLRRFSNNITLMFDGDGAGQKAALKNTDVVLKEGLSVRVVLLPAEHDPDTFARTHSAEEVRKYIAENSQDFISFKAKLLLADTHNDPIRRSEVTKSMVESIALVPDNIQRSLYIKECAQLMGVDENILIGEVARKRVLPMGDKEAEEFVRREHRRRWQERKGEEQRPSEDNIHLGQISVGSSEASLEREIIYYLLVHGDKEFDFKEGRKIVAINVADLIVSELSEDGFGFKNAAYNIIYKHYNELRNQGSYPSPQEYINHPNPEVCNAAVDVLTTDETYAESELWTKKEVHITSESEILGEGVPKVIQLFKTKRLTMMIESLQQRLGDENLSEEEFADIMSRLVTLNRAKVMLTKQVNRLSI